MAAPVYPADYGDCTTLPDSLVEAQLALDAAGIETPIEEVIADKGYHSAASLEVVEFFGMRSYIPEPKSKHKRNCRRGTFEDRFGELNDAIGCRLSSPNFVENEVTMLLGLLSFNLTSMMRNELEDELGGCWDLGRFQQSVLRTGARVVKKSRRLVLHIELAVRDFWEAMARRIGKLNLGSLGESPRGGTSRAYIPRLRHTRTSV